jgi:mono/diheme cytochrome c family protein
MQVQNGKGAMPAWKDALDEDEIEAVANYVFATATNNAW